MYESLDDLYLQLEDAATIRIRTVSWTVLVEDVDPPPVHRRQRGGQSQLVPAPLNSTGVPRSDGRLPQGWIVLLICEGEDIFHSE